MTNTTLKEFVMPGSTLVDTVYRLHQLLFMSLSVQQYSERGHHRAAQGNALRAL